MKDEHLIAFGCRVRRIRTVLGLTGEDLAGRSGLQVSQVAAVERGDYALTLAVVLALIKGLGCAPRVLLRAPALRRALSLEVLSEEAGDLFRPVSPEVQAAILTLMRAVARKRSRPAPQSEPR
jgi:transcriptional regulator with XRE-family HTH domain